MQILGDFNTLSDSPVRAKIPAFFDDVTSNSGFPARSADYLPLAVAI